MDDMLAKEGIGPEGLTLQIRSGQKPWEMQISLHPPSES
jgi:hypothetical protein